MNVMKIYESNYKLLQSIMLYLNPTISVIIFWVTIIVAVLVVGSPRKEHSTIDDLNKLLQPIKPFLSKISTKTASVVRNSPFLNKNAPGKKTFNKVVDDFYDKVQNIPLKHEHGVELVQHWADQAVSSLFVAVANDRLKNETSEMAKDFEKCKSKAKAVSLHAKCVSKLLKGNLGKDFQKALLKTTRRFEKYSFHKKAQIYRSLMDKWKHGKRSKRGRYLWRNDPFRSLSFSPFLSKKDRYSVHRRARRHTTLVIPKSTYRLFSAAEKNALTPVGSVAKLLMESLLSAKNKTQKDVIPWHRVIERAKLAENKKRNDLKSFDRFVKEPLIIKNFPSTDQKNEVEKRAEMPKSVDRMMDLLRSGVRLGFSLAGKNGTELEDRTMNMVSPRFLSIAPEEDPGRNHSVNFLSPSLFSLHGEGRGIENLTSLPNLLKGFSSRDQKLWLDLIFEAAGIPEQIDRLEQELSPNGTLSRKESAALTGNQLLPTIAEIDKQLAIAQKSGKKINRAIDKVNSNDKVPNDTEKVQELYNKEIYGKNGVPLYFTKENVSEAFGSHETKKIDVFEHLHFSMDEVQHQELNRTGFVLLRPDQLRLVYGPQSPFNDSVLLQRFLSLHNDRSRFLSALEKDIETLSQSGKFSIEQKELVMEPHKTNQSRRSKRDLILSPVAFTPYILRPVVNSFIVLSPFLLSPFVLSPTLLGPSILSPRLFVPLILAPRVASPLVLSPWFFVPLILSPLVLQPFILAPGVFNPNIISPNILSPKILSPQLFSPLILSPGVMNPLIFNPNAGSPLILSPVLFFLLDLSQNLSPYVLAPYIHSPIFLGGVILSPYAFSPRIASPLTSSTNLLSPSFMS